MAANLVFRWFVERLREIHRANAGARGAGTALQPDSSGRIGRDQRVAQRLLILFEGATVTYAMRTGQEPIRQARETAEALIR